MSMITIDKRNNDHVELTLSRCTNKDHPDFGGLGVSGGCSGETDIQWVGTDKVLLTDWPPCTAPWVHGNGPSPREQLARKVLIAATLMFFANLGLMVHLIVGLLT